MATPWALVTPVPSSVEPIMKSIVLPETGVLEEDRVADRVVVPRYVPVADATASDEVATVPEVKVTWTFPCRSPGSDRWVR